MGLSMDARQTYPFVGFLIFKSEQIYMQGLTEEIQARGKKGLKEPEAKEVGEGKPASVVENRLMSICGWFLCDFEQPTSSTCYCMNDYMSERVNE